MRSNLRVGALVVQMDIPVLALARVDTGPGPAEVPLTVLSWTRSRKERVSADWSLLPRESSQ